MKAITKYKLNLKLLNSFTMDLIVKKTSCDILLYFPAT